MEDKYLTEKQVATMLQVKPNTLQLWRLRSKGPRYYKIGWSVRYLLSDVQEFINRGAVEPKGE